MLWLGGHVSCIPRQGGQSGGISVLHAGEDPEILGYGDPGYWGDDGRRDCICGCGWDD